MTRYFEYLRPESAEEAVKMKAAHGERAKFWAGGTDMMLQWKGGAVSPDYCIDISYLSDLSYIKQEDGVLRIGAMTTLDQITRSAGLNALSDAMSDAAQLMCTKQTRTIATVGGNLCNGSPSADMYPTLVAMGASVKVLGPNGSREVALDAFHTGVRKTGLANDEMLVEIIVPDVDQNVAASYNRVARTVVDIALVSSAAFLKVDDNGVVVKAGVAMGGVAPTVLRVPSAEELLVGKTLSEINGEVAVQAGELAKNTATAISDIRASKEYRTDMTAVLTKRAIQNCIQKLGGAK